MSLFESASLCITPNGTKASKLYAIKPTDGSGDLSVTRATTATRVNSSGLIKSVSANVPRLDYSNGSCPSILVEPQRTNLALYSEQFDNAYWDKSSTAGTITVTANNTTAPDGTTTADRIAFPATGSGQYSVIVRAFSLSNINYTGSIYLKGLSGGEKIWISFTIDGVNYSSISCDLTTSWKRFDLSSLLPAATNYFQIGIDTRDSSQTPKAAQTVFFWGAQLEAGSYATSYIPTTSASVTRNADVISKTGISSLIGQTEGTMFFDLNLNSRISYNYIFLLTNFSKYISIFITNNTIRLEIVNSSTQVSIDFSNTNNGRFKIGVGYANNNVIYYVNGTLIGSDNSCTIPDTNQIDLTYNSANSIEYKTVALWKTRLTNSELATLTTI